MYILIRDASYTTQPLELLNTIGFGNAQNQTIVTRDLEVKMGDTPKFTDAEQSNSHQSIDGSARNYHSSAILDQEMGTDAEG